jgi:N4-gp56 family major capsid protein
MAKTGFSTNDALTKKLWEESLFRDTLKNAYFSKFMRTSSESIVHVKEQLTKEKGDNITFGIRMRLAGAGVTSGQTLEGNEEKLVTYNHNITLEEYAHAVRDAGPLDRQKVMFSIDQESIDALKGWGGEKIDQLCFDAVTASPTRYFSIQGGSIVTGTSDPSASITAATDVITPNLITFAKTWCKTGGNRTQTPLRPVNIEGKNYFVLLVHPDVIVDLRANTTWSNAAKDALERSPNHVLFSGADYLWDGVVIHSHENIPITTTWGAGAIAGAKCVMLGAQSLVWAWGKRPSIVSETFDYGREHGYAWSFMGRTNKPKFNSKDYGSVAVYIARTKVSDA